MRLLGADRHELCGERSRALIELSEPVSVGRKRSPYVVVSHIERRPETPGISEAMAFLAEEDGCVLDWDEIHVVYGLDFAGALARMVEGLEEM